jgi:lysophospholipase L1-like esterase
MNWLMWMLIGLGILAVLLLSIGWWRYVLTGYLIARVSPYEQVGEGVGSILFVGDSTGYGTGASRSADSIAGRLGTDNPWYTISNNSSNGRTIAGAMRVVSGLSKDNHYDLIVLQIGANDMLAGTSATETTQRMQELVEAAQPYADNIIVLTCGNLGGPLLFQGKDGTKFTNTSRAYNDLMMEIVLQYQNVSFVQLFDEPENDPFLAEPQKYTAIDGLHPTSAGYAVWYTKAKPYFVAVLEQR